MSLVPMGAQELFGSRGLDIAKGGWVSTSVELAIGWQLVMPRSESTMKGGWWRRYGIALFGRTIDFKKGQMDASDGQRISGGGCEDL
ncbi:MAG: hypothetical protein ACOVNV_00705 [Pirellulaceae bacterium]